MHSCEFISTTQRQTDRERVAMEVAMEVARENTMEAARGDTMEGKMDRARVDGARGAVMVVVTLITTMIFQAALNPPGGVWPENSYSATAGNFTCSLATPCVAGTAVLAYSDTDSYVGFVAQNTLSLCFCFLVIIGLVCWYTFDLSSGFNLLGMWVCVLVVYVSLTYLKALKMLSPKFVLQRHDMNMATGIYVYVFVSSTFVMYIGFGFMRHYKKRKWIRTCLGGSDDESNLV